MPLILGTQGPDNKTGSDSSDTFNLLGGDDIAFGRNGSDLMNGGAGNDTLFGGDGDDNLVGSSGVDKLFGGAGADRFTFFGTFFQADSGVGVGKRDIIEDFQVGLDKIDLRSVDANPNVFGDQAFTFIGGKTFGGVPGELRAVLEIQGLVLQMDMNGDKLPDMHIEVQGPLSISANDLLL